MILIRIEPGGDFSVHADREQKETIAIWDETQRPARLIMAEVKNMPPAATLLTQLADYAAGGLVNVDVVKLRQNDILYEWDPHTGIIAACPVID